MSSQGSTSIEGRDTPLPRRTSSAGQDSPDERAITALMAALYECISFPEGSEPDWTRMQSVFSPRASITRITPEGTDYLDLEGFQAMAQELMEVGAYTSFYETEIASSSNVCGSVASRVSVYETRSSETASRPLVRGVNLLQLICQQGQWRVLSLLWQDESDPALQRAVEKLVVQHG